MHKPSDKLWKSETVQALLHEGRLLLTEEEKRKRKALRNAKFYAEKRRQREEINTLLREKKITQEEANTRLGEYKANIGWYGTAELKKGLLSDFGYLLDQISTVYSEPKQPLQNRLSNIWPTEPGEEAYIEFVLALIPIKKLLKTDNILDPGLHRILKALLHPQLNHLSKWLSSEQKPPLLAVLNGSIAAVKEKYRTKQDESRFNKRWCETRNRAILEAAPLSDTIPLFVWRQTLDFAFTSLRAVKGDSDDSGSEEAGAGTQVVPALETLSADGHVDMS